MSDILEHTPHELRVIPIDRLFVDYSYHREPAEQHRVKFRFRCEGLHSRRVILIVVYRPDYTPPLPRWRLRLRKLLFWRDYRYYAVVDGAMRFKAIEYEGTWTNLPCMVYGEEVYAGGQTSAQLEAALFVALNSQRRL